MFFPVKKIFWGLVIVIIALMMIYTFNTLSINFLATPLSEKWITAFHIDFEANIPTWFSSTLLLSTAFASLLILRFERQHPEVSSSRKIFWISFLLMYLYLSLDETATLHEISGRVTGIPWVYLYAPITLLFFGYCIYSLWFQKIATPSTAAWIVSGMVVAAVGGVVMEWVGLQFPLPYAFNQVRIVLEESGEMLGAVFVLRGCLTEVNRMAKQALTKSA